MWIESVPDEKGSESTRTLGAALEDEKARQE